jgi:hypothetical protein
MFDHRNSLKCLFCITQHDKSVRRKIGEAMADNSKGRNILSPAIMRSRNNSPLRFRDSELFKAFTIRNRIQSEQWEVHEKDKS